VHDRGGMKHVPTLAHWLKNTAPMTSQQRHGHADQTLSAAYASPTDAGRRRQAAGTCAQDADQHQSLSVIRCLAPTPCQIADYLRDWMIV
jgi:hypothetical protein